MFSDALGNKISNQYNRSVTFNNDQSKGKKSDQVVGIGAKRDGNNNINVNDSDIQDSSFVGGNSGTNTTGDSNNNINVSGSDIQDSSFIGGNDDNNSSDSGGRSADGGEGGDPIANNGTSSTGDGNNNINVFGSDVQDSSFVGGNEDNNASDSKGRNVDGDNGGNTIANSISDNGNSTAISDGGDGINGGNGGNTIANSVSNGGNSTAISHGGNSDTGALGSRNSSDGNATGGNGGDAIANSIDNGGNSTAISDGGNSVTDGQTRGNSSDTGGNSVDGGASAGNGTNADPSGSDASLISQSVDLVPQGSSGFSVSDGDPSMEYSPGWGLLVISPHTFHTTSQVGSALQHSFNGTQILVIGLLPPGNSTVSANYSVDGGPPETQLFFTSAPLPFANHTIDIVVLEADQSRNYSIDYLEVLTPLTPPVTEGSVSASRGGSISGADVSAIVGGVLGSLVLILGAGLLCWLRRRRVHRVTASKEPEEVFIRQEKHEHDIEPYNYESRVPYMGGKRLVALPRSPLHDIRLSGSFDHASRNSFVTVRTASASDEVSQTVV